MCHDSIYQPDAFECFCFSLTPSQRLPVEIFMQLNQLWNRKKIQNRQELSDMFLWSAWQEKYPDKWLLKRNSESRCTTAHTWRDLWTPTHNLFFNTNITTITTADEYDDIHVTWKQKVLSFTIRMSPLWVDVVKCSELNSGSQVTVVKKVGWRALWFSPLQNTHMLMKTVKWWTPNSTYLSKHGWKAEQRMRWKRRRMKRRR